MEKENLVTPTIYIYIHICCINNWKSVFDKLLYMIKESGLYDKTTEVRCGVLSQNIDIETDIKYITRNDDKIKIIGFSSNIRLYEVPTINTLYYNLNPNNAPPTYVLYLHTKSVTKPENIYMNDWVNYLCHFNIKKHEDCINKLNEGYDAVGVNLQHEPKLHFSGNFWWSRGEHINTLQSCGYHDYHAPEMWICQRQDGRYFSLFNSNENHYRERWEEYNYNSSIISK
jgi:hypothetical protein